MFLVKFAKGSQLCQRDIGEYIAQNDASENYREP
jgi:hypothetical protein